MTGELDRTHRARARTATGAAAGALLAGILTATATAQEPLARPEGSVILTIEGAIARTNDGDAARLDRAMLADLPSATLETETVVTDGVHTFEGVLMRDILGLVGAEGETVSARALNDYVIDIPMADFERFDVLAATVMDGERLTPRDKGPIWIVYPRNDFEELRDIRYDYRWVWQLEHLEVKP